MKNSVPLRVLVIEDHHLVRLGAIAQLEAAGLECLPPYSQIDNVSSSLRSPEHVDVVVLDLDLGDGRTLDQNLGEVCGWGIPVVVNTAYRFEPIRNACFELGITGFVAKTDEPSPLVEAVTKAARRQRFEHGVTYEVDGRRVNFTPTEITILSWLPIESESKELAKIIHYAPATIDGLCHHISQKTGISKRTKLAVWADRQKMQLLVDRELYEAYLERAEPGAA